MTFLCVLQLIFIVMKLCKVIGWNWWIVFTPAYLAVAYFLFIIIGNIWCVYDDAKKIKRREDRRNR